MAENTPLEVFLNKFHRKVKYKKAVQVLFWTAFFNEINTLDFASNLDLIVIQIVVLDKLF